VKVRPAAYALAWTHNWPLGGKPPKVTFPAPLVDSVRMMPVGWPLVIPVESVTAIESSRAPFELSTVIVVELGFGPLGVLDELELQAVTAQSKATAPAARNRYGIAGMLPLPSARESTSKPILSAA
jgi:hypothetical protein